MIAPILKQRWLDPLADSTNPIAHVKRFFRRFVKEDIKSGSFVQGCPLNNLAQEMSPLDEGFRKRIDKLYGSWRKCYETAFADGLKAGKWRKGISPRDVGALDVASQGGICGTRESLRSPGVMAQSE